MVTRLGDQMSQQSQQSMSESENYSCDSTHTSCLSLNSVDIKRNPISSQLSGHDYILYSAPGLKKSKRSKGKIDRIMVEKKQNDSRPLRRDIFISCREG